MALFAHIETGFALDPQENRSRDEYAARFGADIGQAWTIAQVPADTVHGAKDNGNGTFTNPVIPAPLPTPNTPNNPYFGKKPMPTDEFYGLTGQTLGSRYPRLRNDVAFLWVKDVIDHVEIVDPDDKAGRFLAVLNYLTHTNASDGQPLMSAQDIAAIMTSWK